jgi:hypothetical protein
VLKDRPRQRSLRFGESLSPTESHDVAIGLPTVELPSVDYVFPLSEQEMMTEPMAWLRIGGIKHELAKVFV